MARSIGFGLDAGLICVGCNRVVRHAEYGNSILLWAPIQNYVLTQTPEIVKTGIEMNQVAPLEQAHLIKQRTN